MAIQSVSTGLTAALRTPHFELSLDRTLTQAQHPLRRATRDRRLKTGCHFMSLIRRFSGLAVAVLVLAGLATSVQAAPLSKMADVNGVKIHYLTEGNGPPIILLHGYAETSHMWLPLIGKLATNHTVIAPDLRGFGDSGTPADGYTKKLMAQDIHALVQSIGIKSAAVVGHDIGLMVAYAYAAQYPAETNRVVLMEAFLPGVGEWQTVFLLRDLWHFHFYGPTPLALVKGRERTYLDHFWNDFAADPKHSLSEADRNYYSDAYAKGDHMRASFEVFRAFPQDAEDFAEFAKTPLTMPMLVLSGEKAGGNFLIEQGKMVDPSAEGHLIMGKGHWLMEEAPDETMALLVEFLNRP